MHLASSLSRASCPPLCSYYTVPQDPTPTALSTRRVSESAPSESSKGDRGGSESSRFKHRDPLLCGGSQQQRWGMHGRQEVKFWESTALQEYKTITDERRARRQDATVSPQESLGFHRQEGPQLRLCSDALTCKG